jgi:hypothetical protein
LIARSNAARAKRLSNVRSTKAFRPVLHETLSRVADFAKLLTNSENSPETQRKLLNKVVEPPSGSGSRKAPAETRETAETQVPRHTTVARRAGASTTGQALGVQGGEMAPHALH